jgi:hypothetical protein
MTLIYLHSARLTAQLPIMKLVLVCLFHSSITNPILPASHLSSTMERWNDPDGVGAAWNELVSGPDVSKDEDEDGDKVSVKGPYPYGNAHAHAHSQAPGDDSIKWAPDAQTYIRMSTSGEDRDGLSLDLRRVECRGME